MQPSLHPWLCLPRCLLPLPVRRWFSTSLRNTVQVYSCTGPPVPAVCPTWQRHWPMVQRSTGSILRMRRGRRWSWPCREWVQFVFFFGYRFWQNYSRTIVKIGYISDSSTGQRYGWDFPGMSVVTSAEGGVENSSERERNSERRAEVELFSVTGDSCCHSQWQEKSR